MIPDKPNFTNRQQIALEVKQQICCLLKWDEMQYAEYQYRIGISYLHWYLPSDEYARKQLERSKLFWNWFKNQWTIHDESILSFEDYKYCSIDICRGIYEQVHCPRALVIEIKPNAIVLREIKIKQSL